jgi:hypothetical protein
VSIAQQNPAFPDAAQRYAAFLAGIFGHRPVERATSRFREPPEPKDAARAAGEGEGSEWELQTRWFAGEYGRQFTGTEGESIEIVQFGHWNRSAGPDFTEAAVRIDGVTRQGAIEIDLEPTGWEQHGHGSNPAFDEVVLHIFPRPEGGAGIAPDRESARFFTRDSRHRSIPQLALPPLESEGAPAAVKRRWLPEARLGRCAEPLAGMDPGALESLMVAAAQYRLLGKARRFTTIAQAHSDSQALFQTIAEALGFRHNKLVMAALAQRLTVSTLRKMEEIDREALLFGVAGFLDPGQYESATGDAERRYLRSLWDCWWRHRAAHEATAPERRLKWHMAGVRPANHPHRRVAALGTLTHGWARLRQLVAKKPESDRGGEWVAGLREHFGGLRHDYWDWHFTLRAGTPEAAPLALIGKDRILDLLGNVLIPAAIGDQPRLWGAYLDLPASVENESLRRAGLRLFGTEGEAKAGGPRRFWRQQALLQIYRDFCLADFSECADCPFPEQLSQWKSTDPV